MQDWFDQAGSASPKSQPTTVGFLLVPSFALLPYASAIEPLRAANVLADRELYRWVHIAPHGRAAYASNGVAIPVEHSVKDAFLPDLLLICAGTGIEKFSHEPTFAWIRTLARRGIPLGGVSGGAYVLARAGVLNGYRATIHWDHFAGFREQFPDLQATDNLYEIDRDRMTCSGGITPIDFMHEIIRRMHGPELATRMSDWFLHTSIREGDVPSRMNLRMRTGASDARILEVIRLMEENVENPLAIEELSNSAGISTRQLERIFLKCTGSTISKYYLNIRLKISRNLLRQTSLSVLEVALASGFSSGSHFSRAYKKKFGVAPIVEKNIVRI